MSSNGLRDESVASLRDLDVIYDPVVGLGRRFPVAGALQIANTLFHSRFVLEVVRPVGLLEYNLKRKEKVIFREMVFN